MPDTATPNMDPPAWQAVASAPLRVCDLGGWTDTWFAGHGVVCNLAVTPAAHAVARGWPAAPGHPGTVRFVTPDLPGPHPLLEAVAAEVGLGPGVMAEVEVSCAVPPGSALGTSAAVSVAVAGALDAVAAQAQAEAGRPRQTAEALARLAHRAEHERLGRQSGIQDQLAAAHGGASWIEIGPFPQARVEPVPLPAGTWEELDRRLLTVYLGRPHDSDAVHRQVIAGLEQGRRSDNGLERLRACARAGRDALVAGDLVAYARALVANTEAQAGLHPGLVGAAAQVAIDAARSVGARGWKVNGAGGGGGSVTVMTDGGPDARRNLATALRSRTAADAAGPALRLLPLALSPSGLRVGGAGNAGPGQSV